MDQLPFDVLHILIKILPHKDVVRLSAVCKRFRELCLPHLFTEIHMDTGVYMNSEGFELSNLLQLKKLCSANDISKFYNDYQDGYLQTSCCRLSFSVFEGSFQLIPTHIIEMELKYLLMKAIILLDMDL